MKSTTALLLGLAFVTGLTGCRVDNPVSTTDREAVNAAVYTTPTPAAELPWLSTGVVDFDALGPRCFPRIPGVDGQIFNFGFPLTNSYETVAFLNGFDIQRQFYWNKPWKYQLGSRSKDSSGKIHCGYSFPPTMDTQGEWEGSGGTLWVHLVLGIGDVTLWKFDRVENVNFHRISQPDPPSSGNNTPVSFTPIPGCDQFVYDPNACTDAGANWGNGTGGNGGSPQGCPIEWVTVEISYDGGATWSELWSGWATTC